MHVPYKQDIFSKIDELGFQKHQIQSDNRHMIGQKKVPNFFNEHYKLCLSEDIHNEGTTIIW